MAKSFKISQAPAAEEITDSFGVAAHDGEGGSVQVSGKLIRKPKPIEMINPSKVSNILSKVWRADIVKAATTPNQYLDTHCIILTAPCKEFLAIRLLFKTVDSGTPNVIAVAAVTASKTDPVTPTVGATKTNNPTTGWCDVRFGAGTTGTYPTWSTGSDLIPNTLGSNWLELPSVTPTDGDYPYVMIRLKHSGDYSYMNVGGATTPANVEQWIENRLAVGVDAVTDVSLATAATATTLHTLYGFQGIEFKTSSCMGLRVLCVGDSITQGVGAVATEGNSQYSWVPQVQAKARGLAKAVNTLNFGFGGTTTSTYFTFGRYAVDIHSPNIALYSVFSPNDGWLTSGVRGNAFYRARMFAHYCFDRQCMPVFIFLAPINHDRWANEEMNTLVSDCIDTGIPVIDCRSQILT
jgi:lysophospholipase L1-like esterase